jgi:uncharacterized protein YrrD
MDFKNGTSVYASDGKGAGSLHRVVINPETMDITHLVVQKGMLSSEDRLIPLEKVSEATPERIDLTCSSEDVKEMSSLDVKKYGPSAEGQNFERMGAGMYLSPSTAREVLIQTIRSIPDELVALKEGATVVSADDRHIGSIEQVFAEFGKVTHFIASHGMLLKSRKAIPVEWVQTMSDEEVRLNVVASRVENEG